MTKAEIDQILGCPTLDLEEVFKLASENGMAIMLDTKDWARDIPGYTDLFINKMVAMIKQYHLENHIVSSAFNEYPQLLKNRIPTILTGVSIPVAEDLDEATLSGYVAQAR